jgi:hypothetical protein
MYNVAYKPLLMVHIVCMLLSKTHFRLRSGMSSGTYLKTTSSNDIVVSETLSSYTWFQTSATKYLRTALFCIIPERVVVI